MRRWQGLMLLFLFTGLVETTGFSHYLTYNFRILEGFGLPPEQVKLWVGILGSLTFLLGLPLAPFWGTWADRYSRKAIIARSALIEAALFSFVGLSRNLPELVASAALAGLVLGNTGVMFAALSEMAPKQRVGFALSVVGAAGPLGFAVGPLIGGVLINGITVQGVTFPGVGLRTLLLMDGGLSLVAGLLLLVLFREPPRPRITGVSVLAQVRQAVATAAREPVLRALFAVSVTGYVAQRLATSYMPLFIAQQYGGTDVERVVGIIIGAGSAATGVLAPAWGAAGDRAGYARLWPLALVGTAAGYALLSVTGAAGESLLQLGALWVLVGSVQAGINPLFYALLALRAPEGQRATVLNFSYFPLYLGGLIGPATGALLSSWGTPVPVLFLVGAAVLGVGALIAARAVTPAQTAAGT